MPPKVIRKPSKSVSKVVKVIQKFAFDLRPGGISRSDWLLFRGRFHNTTTRLFRHKFLSLRARECISGDSSIVLATPAVVGKHAKTHLCRGQLTAAYPVGGTTDWSSISSDQSNASGGLGSPL